MPERGSLVSDTLVALMWSLTSLCSVAGHPLESLERPSYIIMAFSLLGVVPNRCKVHSFLHHTNTEGETVVSGGGDIANNFINIIRHNTTANPQVKVSTLRRLPLRNVRIRWKEGNNAE